MFGMRLALSVRRYSAVWSLLAPRIDGELIKKALMSERHRELESDEDHDVVGVNVSTDLPLAPADALLHQVRRFLAFLQRLTREAGDRKSARVLRSLIRSTADS